MATAIELADARPGLRRARRARRGDAGARAAGATLAVFGANGAGKTTLLRILATLLRPHAGDARVLGHDAARARAGRCAGGSACSAHEPLLYRDLTARENLRFHARLHGVAVARVEELLDAVGHARARRRAGAHALARDGPARRRSAARCCTSPSCCCSTSRCAEPRPGRRRARSSR